MLTRSLADADWIRLHEATRTTLYTWDTVLCVIFLADFAYNITGSRPVSEYFIRRRGWLDLIGSIPSFGIYRFTILIRLFRVSRLVWISRRLGRQRRHELVADILRNRGQYAFSFTALMGLIVVSVSSILVLQFESSAPGGNIKTGGDALWWAVVTLCTVGYGDFVPVTTFGRITGTFVMFAGVGIIGALASILASVLVSPATDSGPPAEELIQLFAVTAAQGQSRSVAQNDGVFPVKHRLQFLDPFEVDVR